MASVRDSILTEVLARLNVETGRPTGLNVESYRLTDIEDGNLPHINITNWKEGVEPATEGKRSPLRRRTATFDLEARAKPLDSQTAHAAIDALLVWETKQLMRDSAGKPDFTLGGKLTSIAELSTSIEADETGAPYVLARRQIEATYQTRTENEELEQ